MATIEIDGKKLEAQPGKMLIDIADEAGINIPRFCYHKKLSVAANCRMCLVDVEKAPKPLPACATPVADGMVVQTKSQRAIDAQKSVMEFLLINHPLDCPICDQGGECELQDVSVGYGEDVSQFTEGKRTVKDKNIGPLINTDMTRCIHCTRCVRFGEEIAGMRELGSIGRGEHTEIGTFIEKSVVSEMSGNVIDLCPVGALTSKPYRFSARAWELSQAESIAAHDCIGSNIYVHTRAGKVMRVVPRDNEAINETWIADRDRFSYEGINSDMRLQSPIMKNSHGQWQEVSWETAFDAVVSGLAKAIDNEPSRLGGFAAPSSTQEELYLFQKILRSLGSENIEHRIREADFSDQDSMPSYPSLGSSIESIEKSDAILLIGSNVRKEQPIISHRIHKAAKQGAAVFSINSAHYEFIFDQQNTIVSAAGQLDVDVAALLKCVYEGLEHTLPGALSQYLANISVSTAHREIAQQLQQASNGQLMLGSQVSYQERAGFIRLCAQLIADKTGCVLGFLTEGANTAGAYLSGVLPHRLPGGKKSEQPGWHAKEMLEKNLSAYLLFNVEPELDFLHAEKASLAFKNADFVVAFSVFDSDYLRESCDIILPITSFAETSGTFVNVEGRWQSFSGAVKPLGESRPGWKVLRVLGNWLDLPGFDYQNSEQVRQEVESLAGNLQSESYQVQNVEQVIQHVAEKPSKLENDELSVLTQWPIYSVDAVVRRAVSLQSTIEKPQPSVRLSSESAKAKGLVTGDKVSVTTLHGQSVTLPVMIDSRLANLCVLIESGLPETSSVQKTGAISLTKVM